MKKILFAMAFVTMLTINASAQSNGLFGGFDNNLEDRNSSRQPLISVGQSVYDKNEIGGGPTIPYGANVGGIIGDVPADVPVGSGLLILTAFGTGYAIVRRKKETALYR